MQRALGSRYRPPRSGSRPPPMSCQRRDRGPLRGGPLPFLGGGERQLSIASLLLSVVTPIIISRSQGSKRWHGAQRPSEDRGSRLKMPGLSSHPTDCPIGTDHNLVLAGLGRRTAWVRSHRCGRDTSCYHHLSFSFIFAAVMDASIASALASSRSASAR